MRLMIQREQRNGYPILSICDAVRGLRSIRIRRQTMLQVTSRLKASRSRRATAGLELSSTFCSTMRLESALARHRLRDLADRAQGAHPSIRHFAGGPRAATVRCRADESPGRRQRGTGRRSAGLAANGGPALRVTTAGTRSGAAPTSRDPGAMASPLMGPPYMGLGSTDEAEALSDDASWREVPNLAQRRRSDRIPRSRS